MVTAFPLAATSCGLRAIVVIVAKGLVMVRWLAVLPFCNLSESLGRLFEQRQATDAKFILRFAPVGIECRQVVQHEVIVSKLVQVAPRLDGLAFADDLNLFLQGIAPVGIDARLYLLGAAFGHLLYSVCLCNFLLCRSARLRSASPYTRRRRLYVRCPLHLTLRWWCLLGGLDHGQRRVCLLTMFIFCERGGRGLRFLFFVLFCVCIC